MRSVSGADVASVVLRAAIGSTMVMHGVKHGRSLKGTAGWFGSIGFRQPELQAKLSAVLEVGAGTAVLAGAALPVSTSAVVGTMAVAGVTVHKDNGYFITGEGYEYVLALAAASTALSALGGGPFSVDRRFGGKWSGPAAAAATVALGIGGAAGQLAAFWSKPAPKASS